MASWGMFEAGDRPAEEQWYHSQRTEWLPDGRQGFTVRLPVTPDFARWVLSYGGAVEVVRPDSLREQVWEHAQAVLARSSTVSAPMLENSIAVGVELESA